MSKRSVPLALAVLALGLAHSPALASAREQMLATPAWLKAHTGDRDLVILHVGSPKSYEAGHIANARYVPQDGLSVSGAGDGALTLELPSPKDLHDRLEALGVSDRSRILVYLADGLVPAATRVVLNLDAAGLGDRVKLLDGGLQAWTKAGEPTVAGAPQPVTPGKLAPLKMQPVVVDAAFVQAHQAQPAWRIVDARAPIFYDGLAAGGSPGEKQPKGHVPGAVNIPFSSVTAADQTLKPADQLAAQFKAAGVSKGDHVVVYCHVGWQASAVVFAARSLGMDAKLYDGSFQDWSARRLPVETTVAAK